MRMVKYPSDGPPFFIPADHVPDRPYMSLVIPVGQWNDLGRPEEIDVALFDVATDVTETSGDGVAVEEVVETIDYHFLYAVAPVKPVATARRRALPAAK